jgi:hypothetical protein
MLRTAVLRARRNEFGGLEFDGAAQQGVDDLHEGGPDGFLVLEEGSVVDARGWVFDGAEHALAEVAELFSAGSWASATDSGDFDLSAGFGWHKLFDPLGVGNNFLVVCG